MSSPAAALIKYIGLCSDVVSVAKTLLIAPTMVAVEPPKPLQDLTADDGRATIVETLKTHTDVLSEHLKKNGLSITDPPRHHHSLPAKLQKTQQKSI